MTTVNKPEFQTMAVDDLPPSSKGGRKTTSGFVDAFHALPSRQAIFLPQAGDEPLRNTQSRAFGAVYLVAKSRGRTVSTRIDHDRRGAWIWWEPKS